MSRSAAETLLADVAERFGAKVRRGKFRALCPAHPDKTPSLSGTLNERGDRVLIHCHAGCSAHAVVEAKDLSMADLFVRLGHQTPGNVLRAARVFKPDRRQWTKDVLLSKLPAYVADIMRDPEVRRLFPSVRSEDSLERAIRRLAGSLGVVTRKVGFRSGWRWEYSNGPLADSEPAWVGEPQEAQQTREGDTSEGARTQEARQGDTAFGRETPADGQNVRFVDSPTSWTSSEADTSSPVRYEERREESGFAFRGAGWLSRDPEGGRVVSEASALFGVMSVKDCPRGTESEPSRHHALAAVSSVCLGCSRCGDARTDGLYGRVRPGFWLCARCWRGGVGWAGRRLSP